MTEVLITSGITEEILVLPQTLYRVQHEGSIAKFNDQRGFHFSVQPESFGRLYHGRDLHPALTGIYMNGPVTRKKIFEYCEMLDMKSASGPTQMIALYKEYDQAMNYALHLHYTGKKVITICHVDTTDLGLFGMKEAPWPGAVQLVREFRGDPYLFSLSNASAVLDFPENTLSRHVLMSCGDVPAKCVYRKDTLTFESDEHIRVVSDIRDNQTRYEGVKGGTSPTDLAPRSEDVVVTTMNAALIFDGVDATLSGPSPLASQKDLRQINYRRVFYIDLRNPPPEWIAQRATLRLDGYPSIRRSSNYAIDVVHLLHDI